VLDDVRVPPGEVRVRRVSGVAGLGIIASAQSFGMYVVALVVFGFGEGLYLSVDMALAAAVLPNPEESAKDMGVVNYPGLKDFVGGFGDCPW